MDAIKHEFEIIIQEKKKPSGPKKPSTKDTIINLIILAFILAAFGMLDDLLTSIDSYAAMF